MTVTSAVRRTVADRVVRDILVNAITASIAMPRHLRWLCLRLWGVDVQRASVGARCYFGGNRVRIGAGAYVNTGVFFDGSAPIEIGRKVHLGMGSMLLTGGHRVGPADCRAGEIVPAPVCVGDGSWIGARAVVMPGVTIGAGTIVAAGSVVTESCEPDAMYAGVPARKVRSL